MTKQSDLLADQLPKVGVPVLVTRPLAGAEAFAKELSTRFGNRVRAFVAPLMAPRYLSPDVPSQNFAAVVFTSAQGVEGARRLGVSLPQLAYCVGRKTAAVATSAGFTARSADGDVAALLSLLLSEGCNAPLLYIRGVDTAGDLEKSLLDHGIKAVSLQVYIQDSQPLTAPALHLLRESNPVIAPLFSPRSARLFRRELPADTRAPLHVAAISSAVAQELDGLPVDALFIARQPDATGMLDAVETLLTAMPSP